jgi:hypothetical protein
MSDVERRQTQQRAFSVAACAAVVAMGGPLISHRAEIQKSEEAYRADAVRLAATLAEQRAGVRETMVAASFDDTASPVMWKASYTFGPSEPEPALARDSRLTSGLGALTADHLDMAENAKSEFDCLAEAVYYEARSESLRGQLAVAEVVLNRVRDPRYPKTICGVVFQGQYRATGCQFTFTCDGSTRRKPRGAAWDRARAVALHVQLGLAKPVTNNATHYHTDYVDPYWSAGLVQTATIGSHIFYRFPKTRAEWSRARFALEADQVHRETVRALEAAADGEIEAAPHDLVVELDLEPTDLKVAAVRPL